MAVLASLSFVIDIPVWPARAIWERFFEQGVAISFFQQFTSFFRHPTCRPNH
jgi:hypothetical protein